MSLQNTSSPRLNTATIINIAVVVIAVTAISILWRQNAQLALELTTCQADSSGDGNCCPGNCYPPICTMSPPFSPTAAYYMVSNYRKNHWMTVNQDCPPFNNWKRTGVNQITSAVPYAITTNSDPSVKNDARSAWYNLDTLKQFINTIERLTCTSQTNASCSTQMLLGIRIYYAEYPTDSVALDTLYGITDQQYLGMHTLLMVPTYYDPIKQVDVDYDPINFTDLSCVPKSAFSTLQPISALPPTTTINARNHGGLIPPPYRDDIYWNSTGGAKGAQLMWWVDYVNDNLNSTSYNRIQ